MSTRHARLAALALLLLLPLDASSAPGSVPAKPAGAWSVGPSGCDLASGPLPPELVEAAELLPLPGPRIGSQGDLIDPLGNRLVAGDPPLARPFRLEPGLVAQDLAADGDGGYWLLATSGEASLLAKIDATTAPVHLAPADFARAGALPCARIVAASAGRVVLLSFPGDALVSLPAAELLPGASPVPAVREIGAWGAARCPATGRIVTLRANGGAVNTVVEFAPDLSGVCASQPSALAPVVSEHASSSVSPDLTPAATRMFLSGETGSVHLEAALPGRLLLLSTTDWSDRGPRKRLLLLDSLGRAAECGELTPHPLLPSAAPLRDGSLLLLAFVPASKEPGECSGRLERRVAAPGRLAELFRGRAGKGAAHPHPVDPASAATASAAPVPPASPVPPPAGSLLLSPVEDGSGEVYFTDPAAFRVLRYGPGGEAPAVLKNLCDVVPGGPGILFFASEGRSRAHKIALEYDGDGNYMRILREVDSANPAERHSGFRVVGRDAAGFVHLVYTEGGRFRHERIDYRTARVAATRTLAVDLAGGFAADRPWSVTPEGKLLLSLVKDGAAATLSFD